MHARNVLVSALLVLLVGCGGEAPLGLEVRINPSLAEDTDDLLAEVATPPANDDGSVTYSYAWFRDGALVGDYVDSVLPASATAPEEVWRVVVIPTMRGVAGEVGVATVVIRATDNSVDADEDGHPRPPEGLDCDDEDPDVHPGADEVCDGKDNDCSGGIDDADECVSWTGDWSLTLVGAETTDSFDLGSASDFLVRVELDDVAIIVTPAVQDNEAPVWNRTESITVTSSSVLEVVLLDEDSDGFGGSVNELIAEWSLSGSSLGAFLEANGTHQLDAANSNTWVTFQTTPL